MAKKRGVTVEQAEQIRLKKGLGKGSKLRQLRVKQGYSQRELAELTGISLSAIQKYDQRILDIDKADFDTLLKFSEVLKCPLHEIIENAERLKQLERSKKK